MEFKDIVMKRYACKKFDEKKVPQKKIDELIQMIRFSASSYNLQPWKIKIISDDKTKKKLLPHAWMQPQITTCSHLLVFCTDIKLENLIKRTEKALKANNIGIVKRKTRTTMIKTFLSRFKGVEKEMWAKKQIYIALGNAMNGAKALGLDSCPMEGFSSKKFSEILELPKNLIPTVLCPVGYAADKPKPKIRYETEDILI